MKKVRIGLIGGGFIARVHARSLRRVYGYDVEVASVCCAHIESARAFASEWGVRDACTDYNEILADPSIDAVDICTPAALHAPMIEAAASTGKHIICEKPFTGYFGPDRGEAMYDDLIDRIDAVRAAIEASGVTFMYAENWIYAPMIVKAASILSATGDKILSLRAEASHSGSHACHAARWSETGGGVLIRQGVHPLSAVIWLKMEESRIRGEAFGIESIVAEVGDVCSSLTDDERRFIAARPVDVEDWATMIINFSDGTRATVSAGDYVTGGVRNIVEFNTNAGMTICNIAPNDGMKIYSVTDEKLSDVYLSEKLEQKAGWQPVCFEEDVLRGYAAEMQDFVECVADGRSPASGLDMAYETTKATYAAYLSAERGTRIKY